MILCWCKKRWTHGQSILVQRPRPFVSRGEQFFYIFFYINCSVSIFGQNKGYTLKYSLFLNIYGQESPGWLSLYKLVIIFFFFWEYTETPIFWEKLIGQLIPDRDGRGIARNIKKNYFHFQNSTKKGNNFFLISLASPAHCGPEFIDQSFFSKKLTILYIKKKNAKLKRRGTLFFTSVLHFLFFIFFLHIQNRPFFLEKLIGK